ncbi:MAG: hypothetical protein Q4D19_04195 [Lautropia sp.]|nr:hypothetical protein [Lautropia sp.]
MCNGSGSTEQNERIARYERMDRIAQRLSFIAHAIAIAAFAYFVYGIKVDFDEGSAVREACGNSATWECIERAKAEFRRGR